jgi:hypothetical protein
MTVDELWRSMHVLPTTFYVCGTEGVTIMKPTIWTRIARDLLFEAVKDQFGPYNTWKHPEYPSRARQKVFQDFCEIFAALVGAKSWRAVVHQIKFGVGVQSRNGVHHWDASQARVAILNMAAAFDAGFISNAEFPELVARNSKRVFTIDDLIRSLDLPSNKTTTRRDPGPQIPFDMWIGSLQPSPLPREHR